MFGWFSWDFNGKMGNEIIEMEKISILCKIL